MDDCGFSPEILKPQIASRLSHASHWNRLVRFVQSLEGARINLTAWCGRDVWEKGILASLSALEVLPEWESGVDIGSGAGFPGLVLAIARPGRAMTLIEARRRRARFLEEMVAALELRHVTVVNARAEEYLRTGRRESFDFAAIRAVGDLHLSLELTLPALVAGGVAVLWRGRSVEGEIVSASAWADELGGQLMDPVPLHLPGGPYGALIPVQKMRRSPSNYPRRGSKLGR